MRKKLFIFSNESIFFQDGKYFCDNIDSAIKDSCAVVIMTEWEDYIKIDWSQKEELMLKPAWLFDTRLVANTISLAKTSINYWRLGNKIVENKGIRN